METEVVKETKQVKKKRSAFIARVSRLDSETILHESQDMRGFFVFFWIFLIYYTVYTCYKNYKIHGVLFNIHFAGLITKDIEILFLSDFIMILSCFNVVVIQKLVNRGWLPISPLIQHIYQIIWFAFWISTIYYFDFGMSLLIKVGFNLDLLLCTSSQC